MFDKSDKTRILGIDPGFGRVGWGVVEKIKGDWKHVAHGCIETDKKLIFIDRLVQIQLELNKIIRKYNPNRSAVEDLFFYKNVKTAIQVGQARGVILLTLKQAGLPVDEYTPLQVKQSITGYGRAEKGQIQKLIQMHLQMKDKIKQDDAADALAVALTGGYSLAFKTKTKLAE
ncbi:MAG: crossover junction endodeoxyribonuclease RuvC [Candidatus Magasanikbacteria bacterium RIFOXYC2_FULL_40_16]|uniref:Crossover junction endodeoxyribonuclease RuvC n=2 Tax=Candidatus Magasanikiibacteriota TaxID=1752731 RepID=A0A1F6NHB7_9BACT|nr:MAG: crossover junction endodeoxyribonuclease RuvC [Candidatus Magasanikbacteria bacterium RIFOXYA2_FULL_40_20]OGH83180.1 MAG: crossover junction endodeoxyribonuclease RuvC [Candidatus Magasanikbacteria bacterium RIFOXYB1_FULL_40_15]OGH86657.1 MAG: crossover junction endodeoxyribonuclease RuvC [Candidatus Magasanikbacteria bacterium RIFOXYB2_FULL_40_13]OGH89440.1 MAG: crossover junction endodeoxyribonuclease RuvC [Candidatus Magasanikbacteria bacterium RIFOXYC2_FULL_40_16]